MCIKKILSLIVVTAYTLLLYPNAYAQDEMPEQAPLSSAYTEYLKLSPEEQKGIIPPSPIEIVNPGGTVQLMAASTYPEKFDGRKKDVRGASVKMSVRWRKVRKYGTI